MRFINNGFLLVVIIFIQNAQTQRSPTISYISQEQIKDIGGTVELQCSVQYVQEYPVLWMKVDHTSNSHVLPISTGTSLILHDSRFALRYDEASSTYTLQIKDIQETDAGFYQCQVLISVSNKIAAEVELQVRRPPIISDNSTRSIVVSEGEDNFRNQSKPSKMPTIEDLEREKLILEIRKLKLQIWEKENLNGIPHCELTNNIKNETNCYSAQP